MSSPAGIDPTAPFFFFEVVPVITTTNVVVGICLAVTWVTVILRFWTRTQLVKVFGADDAFMGFTVILFTVFCAGVLKISAIIANKKSATLPELELSTNLLLMCECMYIMTMVFLKISLAVFFLRIMVRTWQRRVVQITVICSTGFGIVYFFFTIFQCGAPVTAWNTIRKMILQQCLTTDEILGMAYTHAAITLSTDLILALIPFAMLQGSQMNKREKWVVYFILTLGTVGVVASALRIQHIRSLTIINPNFYTNALQITIWSTVEPALGITAACLATLRKLFGWTSQQITRVSSGIRTRVTGTQNSIRHDPYNRAKDDLGSYPTETSQCDLVETHEDTKLDQIHLASNEKRQHWHRDVEMAAAPMSMTSSRGHVNEAYG